MYPWASSACLLSCFSRVPLFATPWSVAHQAPLSIEFSRQEYWSVLQCPPWDLPNGEIEPQSLMSLTLAGRFFTTRAAWEALKWQEGLQSQVEKCLRQGSLINSRRCWKCPWWGDLIGRRAWLNQRSLAPRTSSRELEGTGCPRSLVRSSSS